MGLGSSEQINRVANQLAQGNQVSDEDFIAATQLGGLIGASEILPLQRLLGDAINILRGAPQNQADAIKRIGGRLRCAVTTGTFEGIQEATAGIAQDLVEQNLYNPDANIGATADEEFLYGGGAGATLSFLLDNIRGRQLNKLMQLTGSLRKTCWMRCRDSEKAKERCRFLRTDSSLATASPSCLRHRHKRLLRSQRMSLT